MEAVKDVVADGLERTRNWFASIVSFPEAPKMVFNEAEVNLYVLYGSATGTAEEVADRLAREGMSIGMKPFVSSMDDFTLERLITECQLQPDSDKKPLVLFVASTTGQGDTPDNMKQFWSDLRRVYWEPDLLASMTYGLVSLGDSSYEHYNFVGKRLNRRLNQLGAKQLLGDNCLGDDQHDLGYHAALIPWLERFWYVVKSQWKPKVPEPEAGGICFGLLSSFEEEPLPESKFVLAKNDTDVYEGSSLMLDEEAMKARCSLEMREIISNVRVTATEHWQDTRLITIDLQNSALKFSPGDVLTVQPSNLHENVDKFFEIFPDLLTAPPVYLQRNPKMPWTRISPELLSIMGPLPWTWERIVTHMLDIQAVPRLYFFQLMSQFADNELEKEKLTEYSSPDGQEALFAYCNRPKRNVLEVLNDFHHTAKKIKPVYLFELIPMIKPRPFSVASSQKFMPNSVQILVAVVDYQTSIIAKRRGLCSNWLAHQCPEGTVIPVWIKKGSFVFPTVEDDASVIMVGPGTGVAPFRAFLMEFPEAWDKWLFFGCRHEDRDFYFENDFREMLELGLLHYRFAFSRDLEGRKRKYVQDTLMENSKALGEILTKKSFYIYVAGNAKQMPRDVFDAFVKIATDAGMPEADRFFVNTVKQLGRYQEETWS